MPLHILPLPTVHISASLRVPYFPSQVDLKVLVWDGAFGADVKEMRMPLPDFYPSSSTPYDENEDFAARTLGEAIVSSVLYRHRWPQSSLHAIMTIPPLPTRTRVVGVRFLPHQPNLWPPKWPLFVPKSFRNKGCEGITQMERSPSFTGVCFCCFLNCLPAHVTRHRSVDIFPSQTIAHEVTDG